MKKLFSVILVVCLLFTLCACRKKNKDSSDATTTPTADIQTPTYNQPMETDDTLVAISVPLVTENTTSNNGTILFQYTYQNISLVLDEPQVADKIILDFLNRVDSTVASAESTKVMAMSAYNGSSNWVPYLYHVSYSPTRIDHKVLSLFGNNVVYNGAGHPERTCVSASYDLLTGDVLTLASIMNKDATTQQLCDLVLAGLREMAEGDYLYDNYQPTVQNRFLDSDPAYDENWYFTQTGLCFYFAPYEIAPYSSGVITVEIPFEKLTKIVHEAYLPLSRSSTDGKIKVTAFDSIDLSKFSHIAELVAEKDSKMHMIHTDKSVQDVRIIYTDKSGNYTVFAAYNLNTENGIMVQGSDELLKNMKISYKTGSQTVTSPII